MRRISAFVFAVWTTAAGVGLFFSLAYAQEVNNSGMLQEVVLPQVIVAVLGFIATPIIQLASNKLKTQTHRFLAAVGLSTATGLVAYYVVKPPGMDTPEFVLMVWGWSQAAYRLAWRPLWDSTARLGGLGEIRKLQR